MDTDAGIGRVMQIWILYYFGRPDRHGNTEILSISGHTTLVYYNTMQKLEDLVNVIRTIPSVRLSPSSFPPLLWSKHFFYNIFVRQAAFSTIGIPIGLSLATFPIQIGKTLSK